MSFKTPKTFTAGTKAKAAEVNENFEAVEDWLNELIQTKAVRASADTIPNGGAEWKKADHRIESTEASITVPRASLLIVNAVFDFFGEAAAGENVIHVGTLAVDDTAQSQYAIHRFARDSSAGYVKNENTVTQTYVIALSAGVHTTCLWVKHETGTSISGTTKALKTHTGYSYLLLPEP